MEWLVFFISFGVLFLGELGDKTQLIVFNLAIEHEKSYKVGIGATFGFAAIVALGVFFGVVITQIIPLFIISVISGIVFIVIGLLKTRGLKQLYQERKLLKDDRDTIDNRSDIGKEEMPSKLSKFRKNPYFAGFIFIFLMELGDKTQILTITLASIYPYPLEVMLGSFLALVSLAWMGAFFGAIISRKVPKFHLNVVSIAIFIFIGILILITSV
jgi:putative Ca2+/H+ antiporter (TMEM165/GDT1 family)